MSQPGTAQVIRADSRHLPLDDNSVDLVCTSPPYFALRSYQDGGEHYAGQIGDEPTPAEFVDALLEVTAECVRVLKPSGSLFVNLGDKYSGSDGSPGGKSSSTLVGTTSHTRGMSRVGKPQTDVRPKSLIGIPWRYALRCIDTSSGVPVPVVRQMLADVTSGAWTLAECEALLSEYESGPRAGLGLILRAEIIWSKPNGLPESVTDRVRRSHETWFHFTLNPRYYSAVDHIREEHVTDPKVLARLTSIQSDPSGHNTRNRVGEGRHKMGTEHALGKLPGSVWSIPTEPLQVPDHLGVDHFAAFPTEFPRRIIQGWSPDAICDRCGFLLGSSYDYGMLGVQRADHRRTHQDRARAQEGAGDEPLLLQDVLEPLERAQPEDDQVPPTDDAGIRRGLEAWSPDGAEVGLHDGTPAGHVRALGSPTTALRGGASQERDQDGQPDRESGTAREDRARSTPETGATALRVPSLRRTDSDQVDADDSCPNCGGDSFRPSVIADVFGGTGTTALVAKALGRHGITVDMSADYCRLAEWRTNDPKQLAKAARRPFTASDAPMDGQGDLLSLLDGEGA